jgi:S-adenosylmethionine hydrolase
MMRGNRQQATGNRIGAPIITLLTDFGVADTYVGQMKGVIAGLCPGSVLIDLTHAVLPQHIEQGAFLLETALGAFPDGTIHVAVVDPGVGTERAALVLRAGGRSYIGPDNGLLSCALPDALRAGDGAAAVRLPPAIEAVRLTPDAGRFVSPTFHGRDIFAVAAGRLASGASLADLGASVETMIAMPCFRGRPVRPGIVGGHVVHIDHFGNVITSIRAIDLPRRPCSLVLGDHRIETFVTTYAEGHGLVALIGSSGYLEAAEVNGNAAARLNARIGMPARAEAR